MARRGIISELNAWLDRHGYSFGKSKKKAGKAGKAGKKAGPKPSHARVIRQEPTERPVFAEHERDHHITTSGRRALKANQFALPPGPQEKRRGIKGRLPIDTIGRAHSALARASMMHHQGHLSAKQLAAVRRKIHASWPSIDITS